MRTIFFVLILAVVALLAAFQLGLFRTEQTRPAELPTVQAADGKVRVEPGQSPRFEVQTGSVGVGSREANVAVPKVTIEPGQTTVRVPSVEVRPPSREAATNQQ